MHRTRHNKGSTEINSMNTSGRHPAQFIEEIAEINTATNGQAANSG
jgi:hypothetical protein